MGRNKHKNNRNDKIKNANKIETVLQSSELTDTVTPEYSSDIKTEFSTECNKSNIEGVPKKELGHADVNTNKRTYKENESNAEEHTKRKKKKKRSNKTCKISNADVETNVEKSPKKKDNRHADITNEDVDSDVEEQPKKKKKKKHAVTEETKDKKGKKSNRQLKREKFLQRQAEAELAAKHQLKSDSLNYLSQWKYDKQNWKFMKAKQVWLFKNKFSTEMVPDEIWPTLLEYFETGQGNIRNILKDDANKIIKQMDEWTESQENQNIESENATENTEITKPDDITYQRARDLIQCLE